jgi:hypothetical protein
MNCGQQEKSERAC